MTDNESQVISFRELGVIEPICAAIEAIGWKTPTKIQENALPDALKGRDIIGLAETGSGLIVVLYNVINHFNIKSMS